MKNTYEECLRTMYALRRFGIKLGLGTIRKILDGLGNPHHRFQCIHVAGTNGKGSIASTLSTILHACGHKVGLYTSPHLVKFNERICINNHPTSDDNVVDAFKAVKSVQSGDREPTFFEYSTAMALYEFANQRVDWAVIETGMGGRLDATNIIHPALSIISNISLEHRVYLGDTISQIAAEKAGIIKERSPVITGVNQEKAWSVIKDTAIKKSSPVFRLGDDFRVRRNKRGSFSYFGMHHVWRDLQNSLIGNHQIDNSALVLAACEILNDAHTEIPLYHIQYGLAHTYWPGRLETVSKSPLIILDGAHNLMAARNLERFLSTALNNRPITLVIGILDDKPYSGMLKSLVPLCAKVILTRPKIDRALPPEVMEPIVREQISDVIIIPGVADAVKHAVDSAHADSAIIIAGSLYVVGEAKEYFEKTGLNKPWR